MLVERFTSSDHRKHPVSISAIVLADHFLLSYPSLKYVPAEDVNVHKQSTLLALQHNNVPTRGRQSPLLSLIRRSPSPR